MKLVVQVRKRTVQTQKVEVIGIKLLCLHPLGPDTHEHVFMEGGTSGLAKFVETAWTAGVEERLPEQALLSIIACTKGAVLLKIQEPSISIGGTPLFCKERPVATILLTFRIQVAFSLFFFFFQYKESAFGESASFPLLDLHCAPGTKMLLHKASQSCGMRHLCLWFWKVEHSFWNLPWRLRICKAAVSLL